MEFIYSPIILVVCLVLAGVNLYYVRRYGGIPENSFFNKYKPSKDSILIRLKLFKYDNNFNYFLLVPYILVWNISLSIVFLYIIYWCGIKELKILFLNKWFILSIIIFVILIVVYGRLIDLMRIYGKSNDDNGRDFIMKNEKEKTKDDEDKD